MKWSVSDRRSRTISPVLQITVSEWLENRIKEGTVEDYEPLAVRSGECSHNRTSWPALCRFSDALSQDSDPDQARRARGEADFLTSRAVKLAPDDDEVKKLRDEVIKLLGAELGSRNRRN